MLRSHLFRRLVLLRPILAKAGGRSLYATSSKFDSENDYDIDLISLRKTPKKKLLDSIVEPGTIDLARGELRSIDPKIVFKSIEDNKKDPLEGCKYPESDSKGYMTFVQRYQKELQSFLRFIQDSYDDKVVSFDQLNSQELLNSLYIFKDLYQKGKLPNINKYNSISFNYMFEGLRKFLNQDSNFPKILQVYLDTDFERSKILVDLYKFGISKYFSELNSLSKKFDFSKLTVREISNSIGQAIDQFDKMLKAREFDFDELFFTGFFQIQRYKNLKLILDSLPITVNHLLFILNDDEAKKIMRSINEIYAQKNLFEQFSNEHEPELNYVHYLAPESLSNIYKLFEYLYRNMAQSGDPVTAEICGRIWSNLTPLVVDRIAQEKDLKSMHFEDIPKVVLFEDKKSNYEISVLYKLGFSRYVSELALLKQFSGKEYVELMPNDLQNEIHNFMFNFEGSKFIRLRLKEFGKLVESLLQYLCWNLSILDKVSEDKYLLSHEKEVQNFHDKGTEGLLDLRSHPKSERVYFQVPDNSAIFEIVSDLERFRSSILGGFKYSLFDPESLIEIVDFEIASPASNSASNINLYKIRSNLKHLFENNGGNTEIIDTLIYDRSVFLAAEEKIKEKNTYRQIPEELNLHSYCEELRDFQNIDLNQPYGNYSAEEIQSIMDSKIRYVLDKVGSRIPSSVNEENVPHFIKLRYILERLFKSNGKFTPILDSVLHSEEEFNNFEQRLADRSYRQLPDNFKLEEFIPELNDVRLELGIEKFCFCTADEVLLQLLEMELNEKKYNQDRRALFHKLRKNLNFLFRYNNNTTSVLDNVLINSEVLKDLEAQIEIKRRLADSNVKLTYPKEENSSESKFTEDSWKQMITVPVADTANTFDIEDFKNAGSDRKESFSPTLKPQHNEKKGLLSTTAENREKSRSSFEQHIEEAISEALNREKLATSEARREKDSRTSARKSNFDTASKQQGFKTPTPVDKTSLESFLKAAKCEDKQSKEHRFREEKAYEWSRGMCNSNRSLESNNFFDPVTPETLSGNSKVIKGQFASNEYLILTLDGDRIKLAVNPIPINEYDEDILKAFKSMPQEKVRINAKIIRRLQKKDWKFIGCTGNGKMLVFTRGITRRGTTLFKKFRRALIALTLIWFAMVLVRHNRKDNFSEERTQDANIKYPQEKNDDSEVLAKPTQEVGKQREEKSFWKRILWIV